MEANQVQSSLIFFFFSVMDRYERDDRNTGCVHRYDFIRCLIQEAEPYQFQGNETQISWTSVARDTEKRAGPETGTKRKQTNAVIKTHTNTHTNHKIKIIKNKPTKRCFGENRFWKNKDTEGNNRGDTRNAKKENTTTAKGIFAKACKRSYILPSCNRSCYFHVPGFHDNTCKKSL